MMFGNLFSFRVAHAYHLNTLLEQLLKDAGLSVDWKDTILPLVKKVSEQVQINTIKTNYGKFNIGFAAVKVWNHLDKSIKHLPLKTFKNKVKLNILQSYCS